MDRTDFDWNLTAACAELVAVTREFMLHKTAARQGAEVVPCPTDLIDRLSAASAKVVSHKIGQEAGAILTRMVAARVRARRQHALLGMVAVCLFLASVLAMAIGSIRSVVCG